MNSISVINTFEGENKVILFFFPISTNATLAKNSHKSTELLSGRFCASFLHISYKFATVRRAKKRRELCQVEFVINELIWKSQELHLFCCHRIGFHAISRKKLDTIIIASLSLSHTFRLFVHMASEASRCAFQTPIRIDRKNVIIIQCEIFISAKRNALFFNLSRSRKFYTNKHVFCAHFMGNLL